MFVGTFVAQQQPLAPDPRNWRDDPAEPVGPMLFKPSAKKMSQLAKPIDPNWARSEKGKFFRFINLRPQDLGLEGQTGVFILWHGGVRPTWVFVGTSRNLARDLQWCAENEEIMHFERFGGLFATWAFIKKEFQAGAARYLTQVARPAVANPLAPTTAVDPIPIMLPGAKAA